MYKLDFMNERLPAWLRAPVDRAMLRFANASNSSIISGESTNSDADRGGVRTAVMADEVAAMPNASEVLAAVQPLTNSLFLISTPKGAFGAFYDLHEKWSRECPEWVIRLHWSQHPRFSKGLYYDGDGKPRSPWYDNECKRAPGPKWIAQELDIGFNEAGGQYFETALLDRLIKTTVRAPLATGDLEFDSDLDARFIPIPTGRLLLWCPIGGNGAPPDGDYVIGCDIASGKAGAMSSQSTASVVDAKTGHKVGEFKYNRMTPTNFARYVTALARWFHNAKVIWGCQGPGADFGKTMTEDCRYLNVYLRKDESNLLKKRLAKAGYMESPEGKLMMFGAYLDALNEGRFVNPSREAIDECRQFIYANGTITHAKALQADDPEHKGKLHGDIVVADAMANWLLKEVRPMVKKVADYPPPIGSMAHRFEQRKRQMAELQSYWTA